MQRMEKFFYPKKEYITIYSKPNYKTKGDITIDGTTITVNIPSFIQALKRIRRDVE